MGPSKGSEAETERSDEALSLSGNLERIAASYSDCINCMNYDVSRFTDCHTDMRLTKSTV